MTITREENVNPTLAYAPPAGSVLADFDVDFGEFDYDTVKEDEGAELWLVRAPTAVRSVPPFSSNPQRILLQYYGKKRSKRRICMKFRCCPLPAWPAALANSRARAPRMIYGHSRRRLPVRVAAAAAAAAVAIIIPTSAQKSSTASPCSCPASEKAESSFSVRAASRILPLSSCALSTEARHATPRHRHTSCRAHTIWSCFGSCYVSKPAARGVP